MKLLYTSPLDPHTNPGPGDHITSVIREWQAQGHEVTLIHFEDGPGAALARTGRRVSPLKRDFQLGKNMLGSRFLRDSDLVYHRFMKSSLLPALLTRLSRRPLIVEVNSDLRREVAHLNRVQTRIVEWIERGNYRLADHIVVVAPGIKEVIRDRHKVPRDKISIVPNGADTALFHPRERESSRRALGLDTSRRYIVFAGAFQRWQGVDVIVEAANQIVEARSDCRFLLVGDGPVFPEITAQIRKLQLESSVRCVGQQPIETAALYMAAADVCLAPYNRNALVDPDAKETYGALMKGSPLKIFSYLAAGRPVIASHFHSAGQLLEELDVGIGIEPSSAPALAAAIEQLLEMPEAQWEDMSTHARAAAVDSFSWEAVATRLEGICLQVVRG